MSEMKYEVHLVDAASSAIGCPANGDVGDRPALINRNDNHSLTQHLYGQRSKHEWETKAIHLPSRKLIGYS